MQITQEITYSDQEIENLIQEIKKLPDNWRSLLYKARELDVDGDDGNKFRIIVRQNDSYPSDFSVILAVLVPLSDQVFDSGATMGRLTRTLTELRRMRSMDSIFTLQQNGIS